MCVSDILKKIFFFMLHDLSKQYIILPDFESLHFFLCAVSYSVCGPSLYLSLCV